MDHSSRAQVSDAGAGINDIQDVSQPQVESLSPQAEGRASKHEAFIDYHDRRLLSFMVVRKIVGTVALLFPLILIAGEVAYRGHFIVQKSVSYYYYTNMGNMLVMAFVAFAFYLFAYQGHASSPTHKWISDNRLADVAAVGLLGLVCFPASIHLEDCPSVPISGGIPYAGCPSTLGSVLHELHFWCALTIFVVLAYMCVFVFPKDHGDGPNKKLHQKVSIACGFVIIGSLLALAAVMWVPGFESFMKLHVKPTFLFESLVISAFGVALLVSGMGHEKNKRLEG